jgi:hypothetical protein
MNKIITSLAFAALLGAGTLASVGAMAQNMDPPVPGHSRVSEIGQRLQNQQNRIDNNVKKGKINAKQEERDEKNDAKVSNELSADEAKNGGHITAAEQAKMNTQLNNNSVRIYNQRN